jgi:hypothetical protein
MLSVTRMTRKDALLRPRRAAPTTGCGRWEVWESLLYLCAGVLEALGPRGPPAGARALMCNLPDIWRAFARRSFRRRGGPQCSK